MPGTPREAGNTPYIPFRTFLNLVIKMEDGVPSRLDSSFLSSQAGGMHLPIIAAFRYLGLVDKEGNTRPALHEIATAGDGRPAIMRRLLEEHYAWANLPLSATQAQLDEAFKMTTGLTGSTLRKAVTFYLHATKYAQIPVSKHYAIPRGAPGGAGAARRPRTVKRRRGGGGGAETPPGPPANTGSGPSGDEFTVKLQAGGSVTLKVNVGHFALSRHKDDREFVQKLMDALTAYEERSPTTDSVDDASEEPTP